MRTSQPANNICLGMAIIVARARRVMKLDFEFPDVESSRFLKSTRTGPYRWQTGDNQLSLKNNLV